MSIKNKRMKASGEKSMANTRFIPANMAKEFGVDEGIWWIPCKKRICQ